MRYIVVKKFHVIFRFLQNMCKIILVGELDFFSSFNFEVVFSNFLADNPPEHFAFFLFLK